MRATCEQILWLGGLVRNVGQVKKAEFGEINALEKSRLYAE